MPVADRHAVAGDHVEHAGREDLLRELDEAEHRQRRLLGRLEDLDVARGERRAELPDGHHQRVVPRRDPGRRCRAARGGSSRCSPRMYSPADLPSSMRAAPAKKRRLSAETRHLVPRRSTSACRRSCDSSCASSSAFSSITSASFRSSSSSARLGVVSSHSGSASFAASTARSTSASVALRHLGDHLAGRRVEHLHRPPSTASTHSPPTKFLCCCDASRS